jgi:AcrR family transcriptional regulator
MSAQTTRLGKQHLLEVAEQLFTEHGYQSVSIRDIAQASGVTNAALYYHFPNKEALFDEVIAHHADKLAQRLYEASKTADTPREQLAAMLMVFASHVAERRSQFYSLPRKPDKVHREQVKKKHALHVKHILAPMEEVLQTAIKQGELRQLPDDYSPASLLLGLFHGMHQHKKQFVNRQISSKDIELIIDIFWDGLKGDIKE